MFILKEDKQIIEELLRKAYELITPTAMHKNLNWYLDRDIRKSQQEKHPKCWLSVNRFGRDIPFFQYVMFLE